MQPILYNGRTFDMSLFEIDPDKQMVNLTKIAKAVGKDVAQWRRLEKTKQFLDAYQRKNSDMQNPHITIHKGNTGDEQGTWVHRKIAIKFAEWISPDFEVWCNEALDELFQKGTVSIQKPKSGAEMLVMYANQLLEHETRMNTIEQNLDTIMADRKNATLFLESVELNAEPAAPISDRKMCSKLVNAISSKTTIAQAEIWTKVYNEMYYRYSFSVNAHKVREGESKLDIVERKEKIPQLLSVIQTIYKQMVGNAVQQDFMN
jgi:hypothetical protein